MRFEHEFAIDRPAGAVWEMFTDTPSVADCLPGAELIAETRPRTYHGRVSLRLGPMKLSFEGDATVRVDESRRTMRIEGTGIDRIGGSRGRISLDVGVTNRDERTLVALDADAVLTGSAAQLGRTGLIEELAGRLIGEFVECLEAKLDAPSPEDASAIRTRSSIGMLVLYRSVAAWVRRAVRRLVRKEHV